VLTPNIAILMILKVPIRSMSDALFAPRRLKCTSGAVDNRQGDG